MNIVFYGQISGGGVDSACFNLVNKLADSHKITIISTGFSEPPALLREDVAYYHLKSDNILRMNLECFKLLKKLSPDIVVTMEALSGMVSFLPTLLCRKKYIVWEHANYYQNQGVSYIQIVRAIELLLSDAYVVLTKRDFQTFQRKFFFKRRLKQIYNMFSKQSEGNYNIASKTIISAGHLRPIKNFDSIPEVASIALKNHPDWTWKIYGSGTDEYLEYLMEKVREYGVENQVEFCGRTNHLIEIMRESALYVLPSLYEGLPMVLLEAKSQRLPIVSFDIETGPDEILRDGINGYLVEPYQKKKMAEKIRFLIENPDVRQSFSDKSELDLPLFSDDTVVKQWLTLFEEIYE